jgi:predicted esterase
MVDGNLALSEHRYDDALENFLNFWQMRRTDVNGMVHVAVTYSYLNEPELAGMFLLEAARYGYTDMQGLTRSYHFDTIRDNLVFIDYLDQVNEFIESDERSKGFLSYIEVPSMIRFRTVLPNDFDPEKSYTIKIMLHGRGGNHNNFKYFTPQLYDTDIIYVAPQAPFPFENIVAREPSFTWSILDHEESSPNSFTITQNYILALTRQLRETYKVSNIFLSGFSQGGFTTLGVGIRNPDVFDGLICYGGGTWPGMLTPEEVEAGSSIPVLIVHGEQDTVVGYEMATNAYELFFSAGYDVTMHSFEGAHNIPVSEFNKAIDWLRTKR